MRAGSSEPRWGPSPSFSSSSSRNGSGGAESPCWRHFWQRSFHRWCCSVATCFRSNCFSFSSLAPCSVFSGSAARRDCAGQPGRGRWWVWGADPQSRYRSCHPGRRGSLVPAPALELGGTPAGLVGSRLRRHRDPALDASQRGRIRPLHSDHQQQRLRSFGNLQPGLPRRSTYPAAWRTPVFIPEYQALFETPGIDEGTLDATLRSKAVGFARGPSRLCRQGNRRQRRCASSRSSGGSVVGQSEGCRSSQRGIGSAIQRWSRRSASPSPRYWPWPGSSQSCARRSRADRRSYGWCRSWRLFSPRLSRVCLDTDSRRPFLLILSAIGALFLWERLNGRMISA